ncbi:hypothetical protein GS397_00860 [Sphingobium yanoikuyae]|uniref:Uncharacterized protein n=1 Tax=Sphingobium yanoikuyae TaxID=13690 RepID=A0A6P1GBP9_SPHYA|nr:hypothetical protein [Sphingobium yanoikuyae]QHD65760.1 hypothetical protein GS397_00860 [Sphingobium yanoikuyae]
MTDRRAFLAGLTIAPAAIVIPAMAATPATQDPAWLALLAQERSAAAAFDQMVDLREEADDRFFDAKAAFMAKWQAEMDEKSGKIWKFIQARPADEGEDERATAGVRDHNAFNADMRAQLDGLDEALRREVGLPDVEDKWLTACDAHSASFRATIAFPSRDPDIIAHKMRMILDRCGDDNGDLRPLLTSIVGEAEA